MDNTNSYSEDNTNNKDHNDKTIEAAEIENLLLRAATEIASVAAAVEKIAAEAEQITALTNALLAGEVDPVAARNELLERVASAKERGEAAQSALERASAILAGTPKE